MNSLDIAEVIPKWNSLALFVRSLSLSDKFHLYSLYTCIAHQFAHRLQLQERLTYQIADEIQRVTETNDVMVMGGASISAWSMRGIKTDSIMSNSVVRGRFRDLPALWTEALSFLAR